MTDEIYGFTAAGVAAARPGEGNIVGAAIPSFSEDET
jgi:hypothetical protein